MLTERLVLLVAISVSCCVLADQRGPTAKCAKAAAAEGEKTPKLTVYSGGHVRKVLTELVGSFQKRTGAAVSYRSGSSGEMLAAATEKGDADLYVAADLRHVRAAEGKNLVAAKMPVASLRLAVVVGKGNPKNIRGLKDLANPGVTVYTEPPEGCQVAAATEDVLARNGLRISRPAVKMDGEAPTLRTAPNFIKTGLLDAAIVWDSTAAQLSDQLDVVAIPPEQNVAVNVVAVMFRFSPNPVMAERFMLFLRSPAARAAWARHGFRTPPAGAPPAAAGKELSEAAKRMIRASQGVLAPVYAPLAEQIVEDLQLAGREGIGIDLGSGPGTLIVELCRHTRLHWINADINPHFFAYFLDLAKTHGVAHRVSAVYADAQDLPFRDNYADVIVSRGCYHFWPDRGKGFAEIYRILKPGGVAYIGRGFSRNLPVETARRIRARQGKKMRYDRQEEAAALRKMLKDIGVNALRVNLPSPAGGEDVNYGLWVEFRKPAAGEKNDG